MDKPPLWLTWVFLAHSSTMLSHVERYEVVKPERLQARQRRSAGGDQLHPDRLRYKLVIEGTERVIDLEKNRDLLGPEYTETHYSDDGKRVTTSPDRDHHCFYQGHVEDQADSSVSVGICSGISGLVRVRQRVYLVEPLGRSDDGDHAVYRWEHMKVNGSKWYDRDQDRDQDLHPRAAGLFKSKSWRTRPFMDTERFVELFVVVDNTEYLQYGGETRGRILTAINHVDKLYRPLNIRIMLVGLEIWSNTDKINVDVNSEAALDRFLLWQQKNLLPGSKHDNAQLVTGKDFNGDTVGLANKFAMCTENSGGVNQDHHNNPIGLASTIAHEMGHGFGLSHDTADCVCGPSDGDGNCVMADKLRTGSQAFPKYFSSCSLDQLAEFLERARPTCLGKPGMKRVIGSGPRCGNAMLDPGEDCDCGTEEECANPCCDASTCRLAAGARCAHGLCCENCQIKPSGSVCRKSSGECDLVELCDGASADCPEDSFHMNGKPCYDHDHGFCYDGRCPSLSQHCWRLFGKGAGVGADLCFDLNKQGDDSMNCGRSRSGSGYVPCPAESRKCGTIFCEGGNESITGKRTDFLMRGKICKAAVDEDRARRMDMVPQGTRCGNNKVCIDNKCVPLSVYGDEKDCDKKCNNNGVCNHKKECVCDAGWAAPRCNVRLSNSSPDHNGIIAGVCASLAVLLLIAAVIGALMCCKNNRCPSQRKAQAPPCRSNPTFQSACPKERPSISSPTFMESSTTQACTPLILGMSPCRPAPQPPSSVSPQMELQTKVQPPAKPLPPANKPRVLKPSPPPVPPVKPSPASIKRQNKSPPPPPPVKPHLHRLT